MFYMANCVAVTRGTANFTTGGGVTRAGIVVYEISGVAASSPVDVGPVNSPSSSPTSITRGPLSTTSTNDILIFAVDVSANQSGTNNSFVAGTGFSFSTAGAATNTRQAIAYEIVSSAQTNATTSMSWAAAASSSSRFIAFKGASTTNTPPALQSVGVSPSSVPGGQGSTGTVTLTSAAPSGGISVSLSSNNAAAQVQLSVIVPANATSATFSITTSTVSASTPVTITASYNGASPTATLTVNPVGSAPPLAVVQAQQNLNANTSVTSISANIATTAGNLLVAFVREGSNAGDNFIVTDNTGQTWTQAGGYNSFNSTNRSGMFYMANSAAVTSVTANFTTGGGVTRPGIVVYEISGVAASSPVDVGPVNNTSSSPTSITSGPLSTTSTNDILIFAVDVSANQSGTNNSFVAGTGFSFSTPRAATT